MMDSMAFRERVDGKWDSLSMESPPATLWQRKGDVVVFHTPGQSQRVGKMEPKAYFPAQFIVGRVVSQEGKTIRVKTIAEFPATAQGRRSDQRQWGA